MESENVVRAFLNDIHPEDVEGLRHIAQPFLNLTMEYQCALYEVETKLKVLNTEFAMAHNRNPIQTIKTRIKRPVSLVEKMKRKGLEVSIENIETHISDIAGIRVICSYLEDIYTVADLLLHQDDIKLVTIKDYIKNPKEGGYRSLHLIVEVPIFLSSGKKPRRVEIQFRTIAMDFWASLEHQMHYKKNVPGLESIAEELRECADTIAGLDRKMQELRNRIEDIVPDLRQG